MSKKKRILVTGAAGFIGYHTCSVLTAMDDVECVIGVDALTYKKEHEFFQRERLDLLKKLPKFFMDYSSITHIREMSRIFSLFKPTHVVHLAAQSSVVESNKRFYSYTSTNVLGFQIIAGMCLRHNVEQLVFASSAAVQDDFNPINIYGSNKLTMENDARILANATTGMIALRFHNVYGPYCRPDSGMYKFATAIKNETPIELYNHGNNFRDFIEIRDVVRSIIWSLNKVSDGFQCFEIGTGIATSTKNVLRILSDKMKKSYTTKPLDARPSEIVYAGANLEKAEISLYFSYQIDLGEGLGYFVDWFNGEKK